MINDKKIVFSGVQPSGNLTIGNYLGALKQFVDLQDEHDCIYCIVDHHAITVPKSAAELSESIMNVAALYLAVGIDPKKSIVFVQSDVPAHAELGWILTCSSTTGELSRMTQFKDKSAKHADNVNVGLFSYPVLMAADILLYQSDLVPVGADQKQHLEIARDIATRFNHIYGDVFTIPEPYIPKIGARVMSLQDPTKKMSKSDENINSWVAILDSKDDIIRKFKRAVTDSDNRICVGEDKPGVSNLIGIYSAVTGKSAEVITAEFEGKGYGDFKIAVGEAVAEELKPIQERYQTFISDKKQLEDIYRQGDEKAFYAARKTLSKVKKKVGFVL